MVSSATLDRVVPISVVLPQNNRRHQMVTLYVRAAAWALWTFHQLSDEDRRELLKQNQLLNALRAAKQRGQTRSTGQVNPLTGQTGPGTTS
jgi:hypothetical protein